MSLKLLLGLTMAGLVSAQSTVTSMFIYDADPQPLAASIVGSDATATTYSINCPPGTDGNDCGMGPGLTLVAGPKTTTYIMNESDEDEDFHWTVVCSVGGTTTAVCTETAKGSAANFPGTHTSMFNDVDLMPVTITAGAITGATTTATATTTAESGTSSGSSDSSSSTASSTQSGESTQTSEGSSSTSATSTSPSSESSTGGMPKITGDGAMVAGGAALALAVALL